MDKQTSKHYFRAQNIIFYALLMGQLIMAGVMVVVNHFSPEEKWNDPCLNNIFLIVISVFAVTGFFAGNFIYKQKIANIKTMDTLAKKMGEYRSVMIVRLALVEGVTLFSIVVFLVTSDYTFLGIAGLHILYFISLRSNVEKIVRDLELSPFERQKLEDPDAIIAEIETGLR